ncbi:MAG: hypothetical protein WDW38_008965 [Sanguina aurantia]
MHDAGTGTRNSASAQQWDVQWEGDIYAVATEAGLSLNAATSIVKAARKGSISRNPGVILSQIVRVQALEVHLGHRQVLAMVRALPTLLNHSDQTLLWNYDVLASMFTHTPTLHAMLQRSPALIIASPFTIWSNLSALACILGVDTDRVMVVAARQPGLLSKSSLSLSARMEDLAGRCGLTQGSLAGLILKQPALLTYCPSTVATNLIAFADLLGVPPARVTRLLERQPTLLMCNRDSLEDKYHALGSLLNVGSMDLSALVAKQPSLLSISSSSLRLKFDHLCKLFQLDYPSTAALLAAAPNLLTRQHAAAGVATRARWMCFSDQRYERCGLLAELWASCSRDWGSSSWDSRTAGQRMMLMDAVTHAHMPLSTHPLLHRPHRLHLVKHYVSPHQRHRTAPPDPPPPFAHPQAPSCPPREGSPVSESLPPSQHSDSDSAGAPPDVAVPLLTAAAAASIAPSSFAGGDGFEPLTAAQHATIQPGPT